MSSFCLFFAFMYSCFCNSAEPNLKYKFQHWSKDCVFWFFFNKEMLVNFSYEEQIWTAKNLVEIAAM